MTEFKERIIKKGYWLYDGITKKGVLIKAINYDFWFETEMDEGLNIEGEDPNLNENGEMYMINWTDSTFENREGFKVGNIDLESTISLAESVINQKIDWVD